MIREMKDSSIEWIGEIPVDWNLIPVKRLFQNKKRIVGSDVDLYKRLALTMNGVIKRSKDDNKGLQPDRFERYQILQKSEIVFKLIDLENVKTSRVGLSQYTGLVSPAYIVISNNREDNRYFYYYFMFMYYNEIYNHLGGDGVRSALNAKDVLCLPIINLDDNSMNRIADYLDDKCAKIDSIIEREQAVIEKLKDYKLSLITEAVTKGLNPNVPMKDSRIEWIGEIPNGWEVTILLALFREHSIKNKGQIENNLLSLSYGKIVRKNISSNEGLLPASFETYNIIENGYIVFRLTDLQNDKRSLRTGLCNERGIITSAYVTLAPIAKDSSAYMHYLFHSYDICKVFYGMGDGVRQSMNYNDLKRIRVIRPPFNEQQEIANYLDSKCSKIASAIDKKQTIIDKLSEYKKSLIYEVVTGKKEV